MRGRFLVALAVGGDVLGEFGVRTLGLDARAFELFAELLAMLDLLLDARDLGADLVDLRLHRVDVLGDGEQRTSAVPVPVAEIVDAIAVSAGGNHTCALRKTGEVLCWGANADGQVSGTAGIETFTKPVFVAGL